jgi:hypothetical protein
LHLERYGKGWENNRKVKKVSRIISQMPTLKPKHEKIQTRKVSNILLKSMLEKVYGASIPRWNLEVKPLIPDELFKGKTTRTMLGAIEDHKAP